jgi:hypothetical protein
VTYRAMLRIRGETAGYSRHPLLELTPDQVVRLKQLLEPLGLLEPVAVAR